MEGKIAAALEAAMEEMGRQEKALKVERYRRLNRFVRPGEILFVGSSLMEQFPIQELLLDLGLPYVVYNRGIGGFTTQELFQVLDVCVYDVRPSHIFINIGTNDMNTPEYTLEGLIRRYREILREIQDHLPQAKLTLLAYYPLCEPVMERDPRMKEVLRSRNNRVIAQANQAVQELAQEMGAAFVNCNEAVCDERGNLREEFTVEGMHLYGDGYAGILQVLLPHLRQAWEGRP